MVIVTLSSPQRPLSVAFALIAGVSLLCGIGSAPAQARGAPDSFAELSAKLLPTVVNISTTATISPDQAAEALPDQGDDSAVKQFLKKLLEKNKTLPRHIAAIGSGFIIDPSGLILTT